MSHGHPTVAAGLIKHVVIIVKENHTFDNYFGTFPGAAGAALPHGPNPPTHDQSHTHSAWLTRATTATKLQFTQADFPAYFAYAREFTLCDNYFSDVAGPSDPNHVMLVAGDSPIIDDSLQSGKTAPVHFATTAPQELVKKGLTWTNYGGYIFDHIAALKGQNHKVSTAFAIDAAAGKLPTVSWLYGSAGHSEHPTQNVTLGSQWTVQQINAIVQGGLWPSTAVFITWDDWGGWSDHVTPPNVEPWPRDGTQFRYGSRVPCLVISPFAKSGHVSKTLVSHVSLLKFCQTLFGLGPIHPRVTAADGMTDCFDFARQPAPPPPANPV